MILISHSNEDRKILFAFTKIFFANLTTFLFFYRMSWQTQLRKKKILRLRRQRSWLMIFCSKYNNSITLCETFINTFVSWSWEMSHQQLDDCFLKQMLKLFFVEYITKIEINLRNVSILFLDRNLNFDEDAYKKLKNNHKLFDIKKIVDNFIEIIIKIQKHCSKRFNDC